MKNTQFVIECQNLTSGNTIKRDSISFDELFNLKYPAEVSQDPLWMFFWNKFDIFAKTKVDFNMKVWNGKHPYEENVTEHICKPGTKVRVWMVSRFEDIGITDNLINPRGYDCRGVKNEELYDWEITRQ